MPGRKDSYTDCKGALRAFGKRSDGAVTVEFVLWLPVLMILLMIFVDASLAFTRQANLWSVSRETARIAARHGFDEGAAVAYAREHAAFGPYTPDVSVNIGAETVTVTISADANAITPFGVLNFALGQTIRASITHTLEPI